MVATHNVLAAGGGGSRPFREGLLLNFDPLLLERCHAEKISSAVYEWLKRASNGGMHE